MQAAIRPQPSFHIRNSSVSPARLAGRAASTGLLFLCWCALLMPTVRPGVLQAADAPQGAAAPVRIAVFDFELEDGSAGAAVTGQDAADTGYLAQAAGEARRLLAASGRYVVLQADGADVEPVKARGIRNCGGCEAAIASKLGAQQALTGIVTRIGRTEYTVQLIVRDARTGEKISGYYTDLRMGANYSWSRGAAWLVKNRMLAADGTPGKLP
jgi:hypothetical protein